jgi:hypothetical protein
VKGAEVFVLVFFSGSVLKTVKTPLLRRSDVEIHSVDPLPTAAGHIVCAAHSRFGTCPVPLWCANVKENDVRLGFALRQAQSC